MMSYGPWGHLWAQSRKQEDEEAGWYLRLDDRPGQWQRDAKCHIWGQTT